MAVSRMSVLLSTRNPCYVMSTLFIAAILSKIWDDSGKGLEQLDSISNLNFLQRCEVFGG
jgi:hypothetical protein